MASTPTPSSHASAPVSVSDVPAVSSKPPRILACVLCQHRKIKCDRSFPCANCLKANVKCTPSTPAPARKRRRPNQDLQERLAKCEELLKEYAAEKPPERATTPRSSNLPTHDEPSPEWQPTGKLVSEHGRMAFMNSPLLATVYEELRAMREIVDTPDEDSNSETATPDVHGALLLGADTPSSKEEVLWPDPIQVLRLWQVFLDRVNPLTKIIHVPSLWPHVAEAANNSCNIPKNVEALLYAIFLMAVVSLTPDECREQLGQSREEALQRYSLGAQQSLYRMKFLKCLDLTTLQAYVLYLMSLHGRYNRHVVWILNGVALRIGQKMGLHRDGETLGLSPFESEMRRRLWWQILIMDTKTAVLSGLSPTVLARDCHTKAPRNVNDGDIFPAATEPFKDREGPTEMIFCLLNYRVAKFIIETPGVETMVMVMEGGSDDPDGGPTEEQLSGYRRSFEKLGKELLEILDKYCDPRAGPVHEMAIRMRQHLLDMINEILTPARLRPEWGSEMKTAKDNTFMVAIRTLEHEEKHYISAKDKGFAWYMHIHFQLDVFLYVAGQLCHRTEGSLVSRAWRQVEVVYTFHPELFDVTNKMHAGLAVFILKAWKRREETIFARTGQLPEMPSYVGKLRSCMPNDDYKTEPTPPNPYTPSSLAETLTIPPENPLDQFLDYLDPSSLGWDMFGSTPANTGQGMPVFPYGMEPPSGW